MWPTLVALVDGQGIPEAEGREALVHHAVELRRHPQILAPARERLTAAIESRAHVSVLIVGHPGIDDVSTQDGFL